MRITIDRVWEIVTQELERREKWEEKLRLRMEVEPHQVKDLIKTISETRARQP